MDARGMQRLLEKIQGLAETAAHVGARYTEGMQREPRLSGAAKAKLEALYREHALRLTRLHAALGLAICDALQAEVEDDAARGQLDLFRANFIALRERAQENLDQEISDAAKLG